MKPDAKKHKPAPSYLRSLVDKIGLTQKEVALTIGVSERTFRQHLSESKSHTDCPYAVQFALECLAND